MVEAGTPGEDVVGSKLECALQSMAWPATVSPPLSPFDKLSCGKISPARPCGQVLLTHSSLRTRCDTLLTR